MRVNRAQITKHYQQISDKSSYVNAEMVRNAWQGLGTECDTLLGAFDKHNRELLKRVGKDRTRSPSNLFAYCHIPKELKERGYLSEDELKVMIEYDFNDNPRLEIVRDLCIFAVLTGLSYIDLKLLSTDKIITAPDGSSKVGALRFWRKSSSPP